MTNFRIMHRFVYGLGLRLGFRNLEAGSGIWCYTGYPAIPPFSIPYPKTFVAFCKFWHCTNSVVFLKSLLRIQIYGTVDQIM